ncbi:hypothetical protein EJ02DRAFT_176251 [Clathrospora elynae]|uniref:Uncharacterized protein n=1 Tax=Clathrospora elynae TaxID=706981 RepID=A0A6A5SP09_9PLEO|nr:hypothetical protein EJ02DRAFT_176251 [Clathrospora elynae]
MAPRNRYLGNLEPGYEYLCSLHDPAIESTSVPAVAGSLLASLQCPHQPLDNRIHPLFELRNWRRIKFKEHKLLRPAIVLASLLLKVPAFSQWWEHTLRGTWQYDSERKLGYLADPKDATCERAHDIKLGVLDPIDVFDNKLPDLLRFGFHPLAAPDGTYLDAKSFGSKETFDDFCAGSEIEAHSFTSAWIMLHSHYLYDLKHLQTYGSPGDLEHIYLRIAITLCHELAHIAWKYRTKCDRLEV